MKTLRLGVGADHAGFELKEVCRKHLEEQGHEVRDFGTHSAESVDYPDFAHPVASAVASGELDLGVLVCGSGQGVAITANRHQDIRCALCWTPELGRLARQHNNANVLALASRFTAQGDALDILDAWLQAEFEGGRHARRVGKMEC